MRNTHLGNARFEQCDFSGARIEEWTSSIAEFIDCRFAGKLLRCKFWGRPWGPLGEALRPKRQRNEFRGNDFRDAELDDCSFVGGIDVSAQLWPNSPQYIRLTRLRERIAAAAREIASWPIGPERKDAEVMLTVLSEPSELEQDEALFRKGNLPMAAETQERVWSLLERDLLDASAHLVKRRRRYLVLHDYGQGGVWAYINADSRSDIARAYPQLEIYDKPPEFLYEADLMRIAATMTIDLADREHPFLRELRRE